MLLHCYSRKGKYLNFSSEKTWGGFLTHQSQCVLLTFQTSDRLIQILTILVSPKMLEVLVSRKFLLPPKMLGKNFKNFQRTRIIKICINLSNDAYLSFVHYSSFNYFPGKTKKSLVIVKIVINSEKAKPSSNVVFFQKKLEGFVPTKANVCLTF